MNSLTLLLGLLTVALAGLSAWCLRNLYINLIQRLAAMQRSADARAAAARTVYCDRELHDHDPVMRIRARGGA